MLPEPFEQEREVISGCCQDGVDGVTLAVGKVVPAPAVFVLDVTLSAALRLLAGQWMTGSTANRTLAQSARSYR